MRCQIATVMLVMLGLASSTRAQSIEEYSFLALHADLPVDGTIRLVQQAPDQNDDASRGTYAVESLSATFLGSTTVAEPALAHVDANASGSDIPALQIRPANPASTVAIFIYVAEPLGSDEMPRLDELPLLDESYVFVSSEPAYILGFQRILSCEERMDELQSSVYDIGATCAEAATQLSIDELGSSLADVGATCAEASTAAQVSALTARVLETARESTVIGVRGELTRLIASLSLTAKEATVTRSLTQVQADLQSIIRSVVAVDAGIRHVHLTMTGRLDRFEELLARMDEKLDQLLGQAVPPTTPRLWP